MRLLFTVPATVMVASTILLSQQPSRNAIGLETDDAALREIRADRGIDHWAEEEILMGLTRPPSLAVRPVPEFDRGGAVLFAVSQDIVESLTLNRRLHTAESAAPVRNGDAQVVETLNAFFCNASGADQDDDTEGDKDADDDDSTWRNLLRRVLEDAQQGCVDGELEKDSLDQHLHSLAVAHDFLEMTAGLAQYVDVVLAVPPVLEEGLATAQLAARMRSFPSGRSLLDSPHTSFLEEPLDSKWMRDYGPFFVRDAKGALLTVDTRYPEATKGTKPNAELRELIRVIAQASRSDGKAEGDQPGEPAASARSDDDRFPSVLSADLRERAGGKLQSRPLSVVRPPLALSGGDFATDGQGTVFTSTETLRENGGSTDLVDLNFQKYLGAQNVVYLHPLPGETVKHIDMFFQAAAPNVLLLGKFAVIADDTPEAQLQGRAAADMEDNLEILRSHYERLGKTVKVIDDDQVALDPRAINIIRVPMPAVLRRSMARSPRRLPCTTPPNATIRCIPACCGSPRSSMRILLRSRMRSRACPSLCAKRPRGIRPTLTI